MLNYIAIKIYIHKDLIADKLYRLIDLFNKSNSHRGLYFVFRNYMHPF